MAQHQGYKKNCFDYFSKLTRGIKDQFQFLHNVYGI